MSNPFGLGVKDVVEAEIKEAMKSEAVTMEKLDRKIRFERNGLLPRAGGEWADEPGNSDWTPNSDAEPGDRNGTNPEHKTWGTMIS